MISTYFRLAWRNLIANKTVSLINIFGLSIAIACCISVFLFLQTYWTLDSFHEHGEQIFMLEYSSETEDETQVWGDAPAQIAGELTANFPQVERVVRIQREGVKLLNKENIFDEVLTYADTGFFEMFTFPLQSGSEAALADPNAVILSAEAANKYFGDMMPIGSSITLVDANREHRQFIVQGVAKPFPNNTSFKFDILTGYHSVHPFLKTQDWKTRTDGIFVQLPDPKDAPMVAKQLDMYIAPFNSANPETPIKSFILENLQNPSPEAYNVINRPAEAHHPALTILFSLIAITMLTLSCFNYVNISLGSISRRLKEIGIRKVMGGQRTQIIVQFMMENLLLCFIALTIGLFLTEIVFIPLLNDIMVLKTELSLSDNKSFWFMLLGLLSITAIASGAYPALYISSFKPVTIFTGKQKFGGKNILRRMLLSIQFVLAFTAVIITIVLLTAAWQWERLTWGYNPNQTLVVQLTAPGQYTLLRDKILQNPNLKHVTGSVHHIGKSFEHETILIKNKKQNVFRFDVGSDYQKVIGLNLSAGRFFEMDRQAEDKEAVVVNETFIKEQGWNEAVGKTLRVETKSYNIIGVVDDFKIFGTGAVHPVIFFSADENDFNYLVASYGSTTGKIFAEQTSKDWDGIFPDTPVNYFFQSDVFENFYHSFGNVSQSFGYIAGLALIIACLGLFGFAVQNFSKRVKEVSIRKMFGASVAQILLMANREFLVLLAGAGIVATTLSYLVISVLLQNIEQFVGSYMPGVFPFLIANLLVFFTAAVSVGKQSWNLAKINLSQALKNAE